MAMILEKTTQDRSLEVRRGDSPPSRARTPGDTAPDIAAPPQAQVATTRFGLLDVDPDLVLTFAEGLIGFAHCRSYIVVRHHEASAFRWLQCLDEPHIAFPVVEPREFCDDYAPTISDADARSLGLTADAPTLLFTIVTVPPRTPRDMTANLLAPLVVNGLTRRGKQVIVQDETYTTRHKIVDEIARRDQRQTLAVTRGTPMRKSA